MTAVPAVVLRKAAASWRDTADMLDGSPTRICGATALRQAADEIEQLCRVAEQHATRGEPS